MDDSAEENDPYRIYAKANNRTVREQWEHDLQTYPGQVMKGYVNWVRSNHPLNRKEDGTLIYPTLP
jgi:hypothetical protein